MIRKLLKLSSVMALSSGNIVPGIKYDIPISTTIIESETYMSTNTYFLTFAARPRAYMFTYENQDTQGNYGTCSMPFDLSISNNFVINSATTQREYFFAPLENEGLTWHFYRYALLNDGSGEKFSSNVYRYRINYQIYYIEQEVSNILENSRHTLYIALTGIYEDLYTLSFATSTIQEEQYLAYLTYKSTTEMPLNMIYSFDDYHIQINGPSGVAPLQINYGLKMIELNPYQSGYTSFFNQFLNNRENYNFTQITNWQLDDNTTLKAFRSDIQTSTYDPVLPRQERAYNEGVDEGESHVQPKGLEWVKALFRTLEGFFNINFGFFTMGQLLGGVMVMGIVIFILRWFR